MIRDATQGDIKAILNIWNPVIRDTLITFNPDEKSPAMLSQMLTDKARAGQPFFVAEHAGAVVGFAHYGQFRGGAGYAKTVEHTIVLSPDGQGLGLGRALMVAIEDHARSAGMHSIWAGVSAANPAGVTFHERVGFVKVARLPEVGYKNDQWIDLILLQKRL